ncbi:MAG: radical SAM protein [Faecousia sp.]
MPGYENCTLCPRQCGVDRTAGQLGFCRMPGQLRAAKAMLHYGEEPPISGAFGTGAVFFSGCTLRCVYCQNREISEGGKGKPLDSARLRAIFERLIDEGAQSIDLVTPTQFLPDILPALTPKLPVPVVYNCGGYERVETLRLLEGLVDVYLPDLKYADNTLAARLSRAPDYFETATAALREMYRQVGAAVLEDGQLVRGLLVRHLVLPGHLDNSLRVIEWLAEAFPKGDVLVSLMSQYIPIGVQEPPLDRRVTAEEYAGAVSWLELCGLRNGYVQDAAAATTEYLPVFDFSGLE